MCRWFLSATIVLTMMGSTFAQQPSREQKVRDDRAKVEKEGFWIYNDLPRAYDEAKKSGKPMLVIMRCIPCEECVKLDDDLVNQDKRVRPLLEKFVCVRIVSTNGLDLSLFQYDYDQSFAAFLMNADGAVYGRFGTRSHRTYWSDDVSIEGLSKALQTGLELHAQYPKIKDSLVGKRGPAPEFASPEKFPALKDKYTAQLNYAGEVAKSCIHCHQIGDAMKQLARSRKQPMPDNLVFPYPHPKSLGLILDPKERATVLRTDPDSLAAEAGFVAGDVIRSLNGQPLLSIADVQWVLQQSSGDGAKIAVVVQRGNATKSFDWKLPKGWRQRDDISWRSSTWGLRRMGTGGMLLETPTKAELAKLNLGDDAIGLRVKHVGQYGPHAAAKNAGFQAGDILLSFDGQTDLHRETDLLAYAVKNRMPGYKVLVTLLRNGKKMELTLPMQE